MLPILITALLLAAPAAAQGSTDGSFAAVAPTAVLRLWEGDAPGALGDGEHDVPTLTVFQPPAERRTGAAVVVFPGGGYGGLAGHEGQGYAEWLCGYGVTAAVLSLALERIGHRNHSLYDGSWSEWGMYEDLAVAKG